MKFRIINLLLVFLFICFAQQVNANEKVKELIAKADYAYDIRDFKQALNLYQSVLDIEAENPTALFQKEACKSALGLKVDCESVKLSIAKGFNAGEAELKFFGCS